MNHQDSEQDNPDVFHESGGRLTKRSESLPARPRTGEEYIVLEHPEMTEEISLANNGDKIEKEAENLFLKEKFPNYEQFWRKFVVPKTNRPTDIQIKIRIPEKEKKIMMLHYSMLRNLYFAKRKIEEGNMGTFKYPVFEETMTRLSSAADTCEEFLMHFFWWRRDYEGEAETIFSTEFDEKKKKSLTGIEKKITEKKAKKNLKKGISYNLAIVSKSDFVKAFSNDENFKKIWKTFETNTMTPIRTYRNKIVHSWRFFLIDGKCPVRGRLTDDWVSLNSEYEKLDGNEKADWVKKNFVEPLNLVTDLFEGFVKGANELWETVVKGIPEDGS